ncbi:MAG: nitrogenase cofactor biosynthesis protein NifB [Anaerocolumna sp.]
MKQNRENPVICGKEVGMRGTLVNLNVNPCKMCMPMGAVTAFYGIKKCMSILHGSQGCSTYIRRHMATHYNEPVDIASSSLTEEGTVYGGEQNLIKGLKNLIAVYEPEVIAVITTCLAETIGEDIVRMIDKFYNDNPEYKNIKIIPVPSAGYAGTQFEGYIKGLYHIVKNIDMDPVKNEKVNIVTSTLSPADTRYLKELLESYSIDYILLPDLSENLDGIYKPQYEKLPSKGTDIEDIKKMAGARLTIEISSFTGDNPSVAEYLYETYGVPYKKYNLPVSLRDNDTLLRLLSEISGIKTSEKLLKQRGRFLDAMVDAHKYNGEARAAVYGEPDFVYSTVRLCVENGIMPLIVATGSKCSNLKSMLEEEIQEVADSYFIEDYKILDDVDFQTIEEYARELGVNVLIGNSDGRRIAEKLNIDLVRRSFPVHDRVGGQRLRTLGYQGALSFLDDISNVILSKKETTFREKLYEQYYKEENPKSTLQQMNTNIIELNVHKKNFTAEEEPVKEKAIEKKTGENKAVVEKTIKEKTIEEKTIEEKTATHPCYNCGAHDYARMHLPIAPKCNISCNYCVRKYDCPNESRPGVTTEILKPEEAFQKYMEVKKRVPNLSVVGIAGPGDALANFGETKKTLELIREQDKEVTFCLSTNGLMLPQYANDLIELGVSHVTVTMNAVDPKIGGKIYKYVNYMGAYYYGEAAAAILMSNQIAGIKMLTSKGIICKVNIVMLKGINEGHIPEIVKKVKEIGGTITNIMQLIPVQGSVFENLPLVNNQEIMEMRKRCGETMQQMYHCKQCRADAIGTLESDRSIEFNACHKKEEAKTISECNTESEDNKERTFQVAVATKSGMIVDQHFGQVSEFYVYEYINGNAVFKERRNIAKYCNGSEECGDKEDKIEAIIKTIADCDAVIAMRIGESPKLKLSQRGIRVFATYDRIEDSVKKVASELSLL